MAQTPQPKPAPAPAHPLATTAEVASLLGVHEHTARRLAASGQLPAIRLGGRWRFSRAAVEALLASVPTAATPTR